MLWVRKLRYPFLQNCSIRLKSKMTNVSVFKEVEGVMGRKNTVLYQPSKIDSTAAHTTNTVVFFPGDVQDFKETMLQHHMARDFVNWCYERTMCTLCEKFPRAAVWLVAPFKKAYGTICNYKNFVKSESIMGVPSHDSDFDGFVHLEKLLNAATERLSTKPNSGQGDIYLVGFSKGCVVLNQFLYELKNQDQSENIVTTGFLNRIKSLYWLDGGHSGEKDLWVTDTDVLDTLVLTPLSKAKFHIHVSPYQVRDTHRPWKGESEAEFVRLLRERQLDLVEKLHFEDESPNIEMHFKILDVF